MSTQAASRRASGVTAPLAGRPALALFALAVAVRLAVALAVRTVGTDEAIMASYGSTWLRTGSYLGIQWPVVYPLASAGLGFLLGGRLAVQVLFVLVGSLAILPLHAAMRRLRGDEAAAWGAGFVAILPAFSAGIVKSGSHSLYLPLLGLALLLQVRALEAPTGRRLVALGLVLSAAYITRTDGIVVLACVAASFLVVPADGDAGRVGLRRGLSRALLGSVTEKVVRTATRPVLTVRESGAQELQGRAPAAPQPRA